MPLVLIERQQCRHSRRNVAFSAMREVQMIRVMTRGVHMCVDVDGEAAGLASWLTQGEATLLSVRIYVCTLHAPLWSSTASYR